MWVGGVRVILTNEKNEILMLCQHHEDRDIWMVPGGAIEDGETSIEAAIREVKEEAGLIVKVESVQEFGVVRRKQKSLLYGDTFVQDNYYYLCEVEEGVEPQTLDDYEQEERFTLEFVEPKWAIEVNRDRDHGPKDQTMIEREARVLEILIQEGRI